VRELIDRMGGTIHVTSRHGEGSRFVMRLPLQRAERRATPRETNNDIDLHGMRVLVVDDDPVNRMLGEAQCTRLGATCDSASDGLDALRVLSNGSFDVVLVDMQMPNMGGLEFARIVSAQRQHPYLIGMTASAALADQEACIAAGMQGFVAKPASLAAITSALQEARRVIATGR
jgi:two-component system, sensor histidine kinase